MKTNSILLALALMATVLLNSCIVPEPGYGGGGYGGGYDDGYAGSSYGSNYGSSGYSQPSYGYGGGGYVGTSYGSNYGRNYCSVCRSYTCSGHHGHAVVQSHPQSHDNHDHDRPRPTSSSSHNHKDDDEPMYKHKSGGAHGGAAGAHPKEWFTSRGYAVSRLQKVR
jgi:opacity protein-like surface antigen